jgi:integrase
MSSAWIRKRKTAKGQTRYLVAYRLGGRGPVKYAGTFKTQRDANIRRDFVAGELAAVRDPAVAIAALSAPKAKTKTILEWGHLYVASRVDAAEKTRRNTDMMLRKLGDLAALHPAEVTAADVRAWIAGELRALAPATIRLYVGQLRLVLDYAGLDPNPSRHRTIKIPRETREEASPPSAAEFLTLVEHLTPRKFRLPVIVMEQTAMRVGETCSLTWGDVDMANNRLRLRAEATKTRRARWVQVPEWLMAVLAETLPLEDRLPARRVFLGVNPRNTGDAMRRACRNAGIVHYTPHDLRHRRASLWHMAGVPARELAERGGWSKADLPLRVYSHLIGVEEVLPEVLEITLL